MNDPSVTTRIAAAIQSLAGVELTTDPPAPAVLLRLSQRAADELGCYEDREGEQLGSRRARWRPLLRRALAMGGAAYARAHAKRDPPSPVLLAELQDLAARHPALAMPAAELRSALRLAETIAANEPAGLRTIALIGAPVLLAIAVARLTDHKLFLLPWDEAPAADWDEILRPLGLDLHVTEPVQPGETLPYWLQGRSQSAVLFPPLAPVAALRSMSMALGALETCPGRRLYWMGHPGRHGAYFALFSLLGKRGLFLERLVPDAGTMELDPDLGRELLEELREAPAEVAARIEAKLVEDLLAARVEHEHLHIFRPVEEVVLRGRRLELVPVQAKDIALYDSWLTPEFCAEVGLEDIEPRPTLEQLRLESWYPGHEWWMFRTLDGVGVGIVNLILNDFWTTRALPFDVGVAERSFRGQGLLNEAVRLSFARIFDQLGAEVLWAIVRVANVRICRGYRSNFFEMTGRLTHPETGEEHEHIEIGAEQYRARRRSGDVDVPVEG
jgi:RimJ/RimL family protein N-acetyltransferase